MKISMSHSVSPYVHDKDKTKCGVKTEDYERLCKAGAMPQDESEKILKRWKQNE